jgi:putative redox protein
MNVNVKWIQNFQFVGHSDTGHAVVMDTPESGDTAPTPMEYVLMALCGCTGMDVVSILKKMRKDVRGVSVEADAEKATENPKVFVKIHLKFRVEGKAVDAASVEQAVKLSEEKYCSVGGMLRKVVSITSEFEIVEAP